MSDYLDGKRRPEPGRLEVEHQSSTNKMPQVSADGNSQVDANVIAQAVVHALGNQGLLNITQLTGQQSSQPVTEANQEVKKDEFNSKRSLSQLADAMTIQRGDKKSNFEDLGKVNKTKKDKKAVDKTIDILKGLE